MEDHEDQKKSRMTTFGSLLKEFKENDALITQLQARNDTIDSILKAVDSLAHSARPEPATAMPVQRKKRRPAQHFRVGIGDKVKAIMADGHQHRVGSLVTQIFGQTATTLDTRAVQNICAARSRKGEYIKMDVNLYKMHPDHLTTPQTANIGHDTRIKVIPRADVEAAAAEAAPNAPETPEEPSEETGQGNGGIQSSSVLSPSRWLNRGQQPQDTRH